jgi:signal transduction histidine kinase
MKLRLGGLHLQLLGLIILPLSLALLAIAVAGINIHQGAMRQLVAERDERAVRAAAEAISEQLHHRDAAILGLSKRLEDGINQTVIIEQSDFLYSDFDAGLGVFNEGGTILAATVPARDWEHWQLDAIIPTIQEGSTFFSEPVIGDEATLVLVGARGGDRIVIGVFSIDEIMRSTILEAGLGSAGYRAFLTDRDGEVLRIVGEQLSTEDLKTHLGVEAALRGEVGSSFIPADDGEHVVAFSPIQLTGWALILEEPWEAVASPVLDLSLAAPLVLVPALLVTLVALWFGARQVIGPIRKLQMQAEALAKSNYAAIDDPVGGIGEIQSLQKTLAWMAHNVREAQSALQRYIGAITDAQEDERRRLARELHDETIQDLIAIDQHIQMIHMEPEKITEAEKQLGNLRREVNDSIKELRRLIRALRPIYLDDLGLVPALEMLANETQSEYGLIVHFNIHGEIQRLDPSAELAIYRIVQEGLINSVKHAGAKKVKLNLQFLEKRLLVDIQDDGIGFTPPDSPRELGVKGHFGLMGIFERAELIGAKLTLDSEEEAGTHVQIELPLLKVDVRT